MLPVPFSVCPMSILLSIILFLLLPCSGVKNTSNGNSDRSSYEFCPATRCSPDGPIVRYPFRLKTQHTFCGREGFELSCLNNQTVLHLPFSGDYYVQEISYLYSWMTIMDVHENTCTPESLLSPNLTNSRFFVPYTTGYTLINCTEKVTSLSSDDALGPIDCMSYDRNFVYVIRSFQSVEMLPSNCSTFQIVESSLGSPVSIFSTPSVDIHWPALYRCGDCEKLGNYCGFNITNNSTICCDKQNSTICVNYHHSRGPIIKILVSTGASFGGIVVLLLVTLLVYKSQRSETEEETQLKVDKFLEDYRTLSPTRYTYSDLKKITSKFTYRLGQGGYGSVYKGKLSNGIPVAVKILEQSKGNGEEFINEVATMSRIHHFNIVRLLGFCSEGTRRALIYEFMPNGSLEKFIFSKINKQRPLNWEKLQKIAMGVARGVDYLHRGCNQRILHFDIKPHNVLLDSNFQPKISDFGLAKLCSKDISIVSITAARGTAGYIAPELFSRNFGDVSYKSDVFSYGMMLLEMVGCRKNIDLTIENQSQIYFPEWIYNKISQGKELNLEVEVDGDEEIAKKLAIVGLWCIQWNPTERPSMTMVIQMLETDLQSLEMPPKPFVSSDDGVDSN